MPKPSQGTEKKEVKPVPSKEEVPVVPTTRAKSRNVSAAAASAPTEAAMPKQAASRSQSQKRGKKSVKETTEVPPRKKAAAKSTTRGKEKGKQKTESSREEATSATIANATNSSPPAAPVSSATASSSSTRARINHQSEVNDDEYKYNVENHDNDETFPVDDDSIPGKPTGNCSCAVYRKAGFTIEFSIFVADSKRIQHGFDLTDMHSTNDWVEMLKEHKVMQFIEYMGPLDISCLVSPGGLMCRKTHWKGNEDDIDIFTTRNPLHPLKERDPSEDGYLGFMGVRGIKRYVKKFVKDMRSRAACIKGEAATMMVGPEIAIRATPADVCDVSTGFIKEPGQCIAWHDKKECQFPYGFTWTPRDSEALRGRRFQYHGNEY